MPETIDRSYFRNGFLDFFNCYLIQQQILKVTSPN